jgi:hypothetical protein
MQITDEIDGTLWEVRYDGKLDTAKCKEIIVFVIAQQGPELFQDLADEEDIDPVELCKKLCDIKLWKRESKFATDGKVFREFRHKDHRVEAYINEEAPGVVNVQITERFFL